MPPAFLESECTDQLLSVTALLLYVRTDEPTDFFKAAVLILGFLVEGFVSLLKGPSIVEACLSRFPFDFARTRAVVGDYI